MNGVVYLVLGTFRTIITFQTPELTQKTKKPKLLLVRTSSENYWGGHC